MTIRRAMAIVVPLMVAILLLFIFFCYQLATTEITKARQAVLVAKTESMAEKLNEQFIEREQLSRIVAETIAANSVEQSRKQYERLLFHFIRLEPRASSVGIAFQPYYKKNIALFAPFVMKDGTRIIATNRYEQASYYYPAQAWYEAGQRATMGKVVWSAPYYEERTKAIMVTASARIVSANGRFIGVAMADYSLAPLQQQIEQWEMGRGGFAILVDGANGVISHPERELAFGQPLHNEERWRQFAYELTDRVQEEVTIDGVRYMTEMTTLTRMNWKLVVFLPKEEVVRPIEQLVMKLIILAAVGLTITLFVVYQVARQLNDQSNWLQQRLQDVSLGDFAEREGDERIGSPFVSLLSSLRQLMESLHLTVERLEALPRGVAPLNDGEVQLQYVLQEVEVQLKLVSAEASEQQLQQLLVLCEQVVSNRDLQRSHLEQLRHVDYQLCQIRELLQLKTVRK